MGRLANTLSKLLMPYSTYAASHLQAQRVMTYSPRYRLAFTLLNEDAASGNAALAWDVRGAIQSELFILRCCRTSLGMHDGLPNTLVRRELLEDGD